MAFRPLLWWAKRDLRWNKSFETSKMASICRVNHIPLNENQAYCANLWQRYWRYQVFCKGIGTIKSFAKVLALLNLCKGFGTIISLAKATALKMLVKLQFFERLKYC